MRQALRTGIFTLCLCFLLSGFSAAFGGYRLMEKDGCLALWDCTKGQWSEITGTPVSSLPEADQEALRSGIFCGSRAEAAARLEDYCG